MFIKKLIILFALFFLVGCPKNVFFKELAKGDITISKNVLTDISNENCYQKYYKPLTISDDEDKRNLIKSLNSLGYTKGDDIIFKETCGYLYLISWDDVEVKVISIGSNGDGMMASINGNIYQIKGDVNFLENYKFEVLD